MLSNILAGVKSMFKPVTLEDYIKAHNPQTVHEVEQLHKDFDRLNSFFAFSPNQ